MLLFMPALLFSLLLLIKHKKKLPSSFSSLRVTHDHKKILAVWESLTADTTRKG